VHTQSNAEELPFGDVLRMSRTPMARYNMFCDDRVAAVLPAQPAGGS
jgi:hypothetical protein